METKDLSDVFKDFITQPAQTQPVLETTEDAIVDPQSEQNGNTTIPLGEQAVKDTTPGVANSTAKPEDATSENVSWDSFITDEVAGTEAKPQVDWSEIGKAIGKTDVKTPEDLTSYIGTLEQTVQELKTNPVFGENIPKQLQEAIEIANKGGDYLAYLDVASVDYSKVDPIELYEDEVAEFFYNADGSFREEDYLTY